MKKILSASLALLLCIVSLLSVDVQTYAYTSYADTISEDEVWTKSWSAYTESKTLNLSVEETALYRISVSDLKQTGCFVIDVYDLTSGFFINYINTNDTIVSAYESSELLLYAEHNYQLICYYYKANTYETIAAQLSVSFNKNTQTIATIPSGNLDSSDLKIQLDSDGASCWVKYKTAAAGDYALDFDVLYASINVYEAPAFEQIGYYDSTCYSKQDDEWGVKDRLVITLKANTEYYFEFTSNHTSNTNLSIFKTTKDVKNIEINVPSYKLSFIEDINEYSFSYTVIYTNNTSEYFNSYYDLEKGGFVAPVVEFTGEIVDIGLDSYLVAGKQPVTVTYNGIETVYYVEVQSIVEWASVYEVKGEEETCTIEYDSDEDSAYWCRIKVSQSGVYSMYRYNEDDFNSNFEYYSVDMINKNNQAVEYNAEIYGWPLVAGEEYVLKFDYIFASNSRNNDIDFWFQKEADLKMGWEKYGKYWLYYDNGVLAKGWLLIGDHWYYFDDNGIMQTGWKYINNIWYYFTLKGNMVTGWHQIGKNWYYFSQYGDMQTGWQLFGNTWYYLGEGGNMITGWKYIGANWYFFSNSGAMQTGWLYQNGIWYYLAEGGNMATGWQLVGSEWYYFNMGGVMQTGWQNVGGTWYYLAPSGRMLTGWQLLGGNWYYFAEWGAWIS